MKVSVITSCFNAEATIGYTIESFLCQSHTDSEMLIIDGASQDRTLEIARTFQDSRITIHSEPDRGLYDAMNRGLSRFTGQAVGFLNADDRYANEDVLAEIAEALGKADIVSGNLDFVNNHVASQVVRRWRGSAYRRGAFRRGWMPAHPTFYVRRKVTEAVGPFDLRYRIAADYDYMLRAFELHDFASCHLEGTMVMMMAGGKSTAGLGAYLKSNFEALDSRRRWLGAAFVDYAFFAKPAQKLGQFIVAGDRA